MLLHTGKNPSESQNQKNQDSIPTTEDPIQTEEANPLRLTGDNMNKITGPTAKEETNLLRTEDNDMTRTKGSMDMTTMIG